MRIDLYTKVILTVIATCLVYLCVGGLSLSSVAHAQRDTENVIVAGWIDADGNRHALPHADKTHALPVDTFQR